MLFLWYPWKCHILKLPCLDFFWNSPYVTLYHWKFKTTCSFTQGNSTNLCYTHWNFHGQKPRPMEIPQYFLLITPRNCTSFLLTPEISTFYHFNTPGNSMPSIPPVWNFSGIAQYMYTLYRSPITFHEHLIAVVIALLGTTATPQNSVLPPDIMSKVVQQFTYFRGCMCDILFCMQFVPFCLTGSIFQNCRLSKCSL